MEVDISWWSRSGGSRIKHWDPVTILCSFLYSLWIPGTVQGERPRNHVSAARYVGILRNMLKIEFSRRIGFIHPLSSVSHLSSSLHFFSIPWYALSFITTAQVLNKSMVCWGPELQCQCSASTALPVKPKRLRWRRAAEYHLLLSVFFFIPPLVTTCLSINIQFCFRYCLRPFQNSSIHSSPLPSPDSAQIQA